MNMKNYQGRNRKQNRRDVPVKNQVDKTKMFLSLEKELNNQRERFLETVPGLIKAANKSEDWVKEQINHALFSYIGSGKAAESLRRCTIPSILKSVKDACDLGVSLAPHRKEAVLMPYKEQCQLHVQYQGHVKLMLQDPNVMEVYADVAHEGDEFSVASGTDRAIHHSYCTNSTDRGRPTWAYAVVVLKNGVKKFEAAPWSEIMKMRASARTVDVWDKWPVQMAKGKMIRRLTNYISLDAPSMDRLLRAAEMEDKAELGVSAEPEIIESDQVQAREPSELIARLKLEAKEQLEKGELNGEEALGENKRESRGVREEAG